MERKQPTPHDPNAFDLLDDELILPEQFFSEPPPTPSGELQLMWAVFSDGVQCFFAERRRGRFNPEIYSEAEEWIRSIDQESIFSFDNLCETFRLDSRALRQKLLDWRRRHPLPQAA